MLNRIKKYFHTQKVKILNQNKFHKNINKKQNLIILIVSDKFFNMDIIDRHKEVYALLCNEMRYINSLSIYTYTLNEFKKHEYYKIKKIKCYNKNINNK